MHWKHWLGIALVLACFAGARAEAEPRIALVIGNAHYAAPNLPALISPTNDARLMAETLKKAGFQVLVVEDADQKQMKEALHTFGDRLAEAGGTATGLFFYSGHAVSLASESYLIPLGTGITNEDDIDIETLALHDIVVQMEYAGVANGILIVDASYRNTLSKESRGFSLAPVLATTRSFLLASSTAPGSFSADSSDEHGPYVTSLAEAMLVPGLPIHDVFDRARKKVLALTGDRQVPWESASMTDPFYFFPAN